MSINLCQSDIANQLGLRKFDNLNLNSLFFENVMNIEIEGVRQVAVNQNCPLKAWNSHVQRLTFINVEKELRSAYHKLVQIVNENDLGGALT